MIETNDNINFGFITEINDDGHQILNADFGEVRGFFVIHPDLEKGSGYKV